VGKSLSHRSIYGVSHMGSKICFLRSNLISVLLRHWSYKIFQLSKGVS